MTSSMTTNAMTTVPKTGFVLSAILLAVAAALFWLARGSDPEDYLRASEDIRQIRQLAAEWSVETARVRSDPFGDYDALAAFIPEVGRLKEALLDAVRDIPTMPERLANDVYAFASALDAKEESIERFKTANSVIRNSVRYLPNAAASIAGSASDAGQARDVTALAEGLGTYTTSPTDEAKGRLTAILERLAEGRDGLPDEEAVALSNFLAHAGILLERQVPTEQIFRRATSGEVSDLAGELLAEFDAQSSGLERRAEFYMIGVWAAVVALLLVWVFVFAMRSRPAPSQQAAAAAAEPALPAPAPAHTNGGSVHHEVQEQDHSLALGQSQKLLMSQRILTEVVGTGIARAVRALPVASDADAVEGAAEIAALAERFASTSAAGNDRYDLVDLKDCADAALKAASAADGATIVAEHCDAPQIFASQTELCLMLEQVLDNSLWAIRAKGLDAEEGEIRMKTAGVGGNALVTVIDNGVGLSTEDRERMFEPFFGTRDDRPGVGLAITQHIVRKYGGRIAVGSQPGGGTVLRISLPGMSA